MQAEQETICFHLLLGKEWRKGFLSNTAPQGGGMKCAAFLPAHVCQIVSLFNHEAVSVCLSAYLFLLVSLPRQPFSLAGPYLSGTDFPTIYWRVTLSSLSSVWFTFPLFRIPADKPTWVLTRMWWSWQQDAVGVPPGELWDPCFCSEFQEGGLHLALTSSTSTELMISHGQFPQWTV